MAVVPHVVHKGCAGQTTVEGLSADESRPSNEGRRSRACLPAEARERARPRRGWVAQGAEREGAHGDVNGGYLEWEGLEVADVKTGGRYVGPSDCEHGLGAVDADDVDTLLDEERSVPARPTRCVQRTRARLAGGGQRSADVVRLGGDERVGFVVGRSPFGVAVDRSSLDRVEREAEREAVATGDNGAEFVEPPLVHFAVFVPAAQQCDAHHAG